MNVKSKKRGRPDKCEEKLENSTIIETAKSLILCERKVPSIRKLAAKLSVDPMAIYHYFPNKQALLEAVTISLIDEICTPDPILSWRENLMTLCKSYLDLLLSYPGLLQIILSVTGEGPADVFQGRYERAIRELDLPEGCKKTVLDLIIDYIHGYAIAADCSELDLSSEYADGPLNYIFDSMEIRGA